MSKSAKKKFNFLKDLVHRVRGVALTYHGTTLSSRDNETFHEGLTLWLCLFCDLLLAGVSPSRQYQCSTMRIVSAWQTRGLDVLDLVKDLGDIDDLVINSAGTLQDPACFKHKLRTLHVTNHWLVGACTDILASSDGPIQMWRQLHQFLKFITRIRLLDVEELIAMTEEKYFTNLSRVRQWRTSTDVEQAIIAKWLESWVPPTLEDCSFGSGATADPKVKCLEEKYAQLQDTARSRHVALKLGIEPTAEIAVRPPQSRLIFVPKSAKIMRPIAAEDPMLMFYQQGLLKSLNHVFRTTPLRRRISLENQTKSRCLARIGSRFPRGYATIDLSSASDSVRYDLVEKWFARTALADALRVCRSTHAVYGDKVIDLPMFASMGSAVCFPVECICFAAQCAATIMSEGMSPSRSNFCVYGDDIIIESRFAPALIKRLEYNGFIVNQDKSFFDENFYFRESCGGEYLKGEDITPLYLSRRFSCNTGDRARMMSALILMANACYARNYSTLRSRVLQLISEWYGNTVLYSDDVSLLEAEKHFGVFEEAQRGTAIFSPTATNYHLQSRYNSKLQRREYRVTAITASEKKCSSVVGRYLYTLHKPEDVAPGGEPRGTARVTARTRLVLRRTWRSAI